MEANGMNRRAGGPNTLRIAALAALLLLIGVASGCSDESCDRANAAFDAAAETVQEIAGYVDTAQDLVDAVCDVTGQPCTDADIALTRLKKLLVQGQELLAAARVVVEIACGELSADQAVRYAAADVPFVITQNATGKVSDAKRIQADAIALRLEAKIAAAR